MLRSLILAGALGLAAPAFAVPFNADKGGTVDLAEARAAGGAVFDKLDVDRDGALDAKELKGRVAKKAWTSIDPDNDMTVSKDEYLAYVESQFKQADADNEGALDNKELRAKGGRELTKLLK